MFVIKINHPSHTSDEATQVCIFKFRYFIILRLKHIIFLWNFWLKLFECIMSEKSSDYTVRKAITLYNVLCFCLFYFLKIDVFAKFCKTLSYDPVIFLNHLLSSQSRPFSVERINRNRKCQRTNIYRFCFSRLFCSR